MKLIIFPRGFCFCLYLFQTYCDSHLGCCTHVRLLWHSLYVFYNERVMVIPNPQQYIIVPNNWRNLVCVCACLRKGDFFLCQVTGQGGMG